MTALVPAADGTDRDHPEGCPKEKYKPHRHVSDSYFNGEDNSRYSKGMLKGSLSLSNGAFPSK